jgi:hypothetical protein
MPVTSLDTEVGGLEFVYATWAGQRLESTRQCPIGFDTETRLIEDPREPPELALGVAADRQHNVVVHADDIGAFLLEHRDEYLAGHNVAFDFWVVDEHLGRRGEDDARRVLWDACHEGRLFDTQLLDMLIQLGTDQFRKDPSKGNSDRKKVYPGNLAEVAADYTTVRIDKEDPYRLRFGELIGVPKDEWGSVDRGFFDYATRDAIATRRLYPALAEEAMQLMADYGFRRRAERYDIRPDAIEEFGYLSEVIQVKASIVLQHMFRRGVCVDVEAAARLEQQHRDGLADVIADMERHHKEVLKYDREGNLLLKPKSRTPSFGQKKLIARLDEVAAEISKSDAGFEKPISQGKQKNTSMSLKAWEPFADQHDFIGRWCRLERASKRLQFFEELKSPRLHCEYNVLVRTGRTSCFRPRDETIPGINLQQIPGDAAFRGLFIAEPGHLFFTSDYKAIELRTLAAVCRARLGQSRLGDVIAEGVDPHANTAASIQGLELDDFMKLKDTDLERFAQARQAAKALNFGIPGGLGAKALKVYAANNYEVEMTQDEARSFRQRLISDIYPELNETDGYLSDPSFEAMSRNLGLAEWRIWEAFDKTGKRNRIAAMGTAKVIRGESTASDRYQDYVWKRLGQLIDSSTEVDQDLRELIKQKQGGRQLHGRLFRQSVASLSGRVRAGVGFTDSKNTPFQAAAADGAKLALWNLLYEGLDVRGFVHDEIIVQMPRATEDADARRAEAIMNASMQEVIGDVPVECEYVVAPHWTKPD